MLATYQQSFRLFSRDVRLFLFAGAFVGFTYFGIYALLLNLYLLRLGYGPAVIGLVNAAGPLALALGSLPAGVLSQRWGSRRSLILGFSLLMLGFGLLPLVEFIPDGGRIGWLVATYMLAWLGGTFFVVSGNPFLVSATTAQERNHAFALQSAILALSGFVGNLVGGLLPGWFAGIFDVGLEQALPYRYPLWFAAALMLPAVFAAWALQPVSDEPDQRSAASSAAAPVTMMLLLTLVFLLRVAGEWAMRIFFNVYLDAGLHETTARIGTLTAVGQLLGIAALSAPLAMARWGKVRTIGWGSVGMACAYLPLILLRHWVGAGLGFMGMVALVSLTNPMFTVFTLESVPARWRNMMAGTMFMAMGGAVALIALGGGYLIEGLGYRTLFLISASLPLVGALLFFSCFGHNRQEVIGLSAVMETRVDQGGEI